MPYKAMVISDPIGGGLYFAARSYGDLARNLKSSGTLYYRADVTRDELIAELHSRNQELENEIAVLRAVVFSEGDGGIIPRGL